jgi:outer membrane protein TolC
MARIHGILGCCLAMTAASAQADQGCANERTLRDVQLADAIGQSLQLQPQLIIARQMSVESRAELLASTAAFLPSVQMSVTDERYKPANAGSPVVVVGNTVLGGSQTISAFGSFSLSWNLMNSGRDWATYQGARAGVRAASSALDSQLDDTLTAVLRAYADLYEAEIDVRTQTNSVVALEAIQARAQERYQSGHGTTVAIGQAREAALDARQSLNRSCRAVADKSAALAQATGILMSPAEIMTAGSGLPNPSVERIQPDDLSQVVEATAEVAAARENLTVAQSKLHEAQRGFGPSIALSVQRNYLGQDTNSFDRANSHLAPYDYRIGLSIQQPLFPLTPAIAQVAHARAELRIAEAKYNEARIDVETKLENALSLQREAESSLAAARMSLQEAEHVLQLTNSLYRAGRSDLDSVEHARLDQLKARSEVQTQESKRTLSQWLVTRSVQPAQFAGLLFREVHLEAAAWQWRQQD